MRTFRSVAAALALLLIGSTAASAADPAGPDWPGRIGRYVFVVTRNGTPIGTQAVEITAKGDTVTATTKSTIAVKLLGIVVYRLRQTLTETYRNGQLLAVSGITTDSNGTNTAELTRDGNHWTGHYNKGQLAFDCDCTASPAWNIASTKGTQMIEASLGALRHVAIEDRGTETLALPEGKVLAHHYAFKGGIAREVWYSPSGNLVSASQTGSDGSKIQERLVKDPDGGKLDQSEASDSPVQ